MKYLFQLSELEELNEKVRSCTACRLSVTRTNAVPGEVDISGIMMLESLLAEMRTLKGALLLAKQAIFLMSFLILPGLREKRCI